MGGSIMYISCCQDKDTDTKTTDATIENKPTKINSPKIHNYLSPTKYIHIRQVSNTRISNLQKLEVINEINHESFSSETIPIYKNSEIPLTSYNDKENVTKENNDDYNLKNYTFSSETNHLINSETVLSNVFNSRSRDYSTKDISFSNITTHSNNNEIIMQDEFCILKKLKSKTLYVDRYFILTRQAVKCFKSKDYFISFSSHMFEIKLSEVEKCTLCKDPFNNKDMIYIHIVHGNSQSLIISTEKNRIATAWIKMMNFMKG